MSAQENLASFQVKPLAIEPLVACTYCQSRVSKSKLSYHINNRCKQAAALRAAAVKAARLAKMKKVKPKTPFSTGKAAEAAVAPPQARPKRVLVRSHLE